MNGQITFGIDAATGNILVALGQINLAFTPADALKFMAALSTILAQHPSIQPKPEPRILVAGCLPQLPG